MWVCISVVSVSFVEPSDNTVWVVDSVTGSLMVLVWADLVVTTDDLILCEDRVEMKLLVCVERVCVR